MSTFPYLIFSRIASPKHNFSCQVNINVYSDRIPTIYKDITTSTTKNILLLQYQHSSHVALSLLQSFYLRRGRFRESLNGRSRFHRTNNAPPPRTINTPATKNRKQSSSHSQAKIYQHFVICSRHCSRLNLFQ